MTIRHLNRIRKKHLEEKTGTSGKNRPPHPPPTSASKPFWWIPRLGKAERLSPFPRRKNEGKNAEPKDHNAKDCKAKEHKVSPKPNVEIGSVLGSYLIFGFCKKRVFLKRRKHNGSCWNVLRPVFSLRTRCAASIRLTKAGAQKPLDAALQQAGLFGGG
jgi:hypothetical protein